MKQTEMKIQRTIRIFTAVTLAVWLVGCKKQTDSAAEAAQDPAYGENAVTQVTNAVAATTEPAKEVAATNATEAVATPATAGGLVRYNAQPGGSKATVSGGSSLHDWSMETGVIGGSMEVHPNFPAAALTDPAAAKPATTVYVPVRSIKSGRATMDERMLETMSAKDHARIEYKLIELKPKSKAGATGPLEFDAVGTLTIVGKTITNTMPVTIEKQDDKLKVTGSTPLKLTQFEIKPPVIALPLLPDISVYDDLKVNFEWTLAPKK